VSELDRLLGPDLVDALKRLVDERVAAVLESHGPVADGSPWLSVPQAAEYAGVSPRTITRLLERGRIRSTRIGRRVLLHRDDLDAYLKETRQ
jgi:excisionase family DNA binding protein